ncbi:MAG: hypothetical protein ACXW61_00045 [Gemmatirosa sp.]
MSASQTTEAPAILPGMPLLALADALARLSTRSELAAIAATGSEVKAEALLVAETARALHSLLCGETASGSTPAARRRKAAVARADDAPSWDVTARVSRMRSWLAARAGSDPTARGAAALCAQVLEALSVH